VPGKSRQPRLQLIPEEILQLEGLRDSASCREGQRARILLRYLSGETVSQIAAGHMTRKSVDKWIHRALAVGASVALKDALPPPEEASRRTPKHGVVHLACSKPKELGYAAI
jgi:hypothetical protein